MNERVGEGIMAPSVADASNNSASQHLTSFAENNPAPLFLVGFDGRIKANNPAARRILDRDPVGHQVVEILPSADSSIWQNQNAGEPVRFEQRLPGGTFEFTVATQPSEQAYYVYSNDITDRKQIEETLTQSLKTTRTILEKVPMGILVVGRDKIIRDINKTALEIAGKKKEDVVGHVCHSTMCLADIGTCPILDLGEDINNSERELLTSEGNRLPILKTVIPVSIDGEDVLLEAFSDISERTRSEESLRKSEERLRAMTDATQDAVIMIDEKGNTTFWNSSAERIFGYSSAEIIGHNLHELIVPDELAEAHAAGFRKFRETGEGNAIGQTVELKAKRKDGTQLPVEISLSSIQVDANWHAVGIVRDVSDRVAREEEFKRTIGHYVAMMNTVPAMAFLKDIDGHYVTANAAFCACVSTDLQELVGKVDDDLPEHPGTIAQKETELQVMREGKAISKQEERLVGNDGEERWTTTTIVPVHDEHGQVTGVVGLIQDVTELHQSRERLVQADKMSAIGTLSAGVAHEINNPVGFINSNLNTMGKYLKKIRGHLEGNTQPDTEAREALVEMLDDFGDAIEESMDGADRVKKIVADLKSFSRVDKAQKESYNLNEGLETTLNIVWNELKYKCTVEKNYSDIPDLYCIPNQLNQVFMNLLVNAGHAVQEDSGRITITTRADKENIYISIRDTGVGIPPENIKKIFEPFYTTKEVGKGTGLGLSMAYEIIKKHSGRIDVTSEVGSGTEFTLTLPLEGLKSSETQYPIG